jgi:hypothetical protein
MLEAVVRDDPYAIGRIAELALLDIAGGDSHDVASSRTMGALRKLAPQLHEVFANIAKKRLPLVAKDSLYVLGLQDAAFLSDIVRARDFVTATYAPSDQAILVELALHKDVPTFTHSPDAAFSYVLIGHQRDGDLHAALVHEFAHARLPTHNRYLDEGIAYFMEGKAQGVDALAQRSRVVDGWPEHLDLRALLTYDSTHDPYFSRLLPGEPGKVHAHAALFVAGLFDRRGFEGLNLLSNSLLSEGGALDVVGCIEGIYGCSISELEPLGAPSDGSAIRKNVPLGDFLMRLTRALIALDEDQIGALERELGFVSSEATSREPEALEAWCRLRLFALLSDVHEHCAEEEALLWVRSLIARYQESDPDDAVLANLKALLSIAEIPFAADEMAGLAHISNVRTLFRKAIELAPGRVDAEYNLARFELLAPDDVPSDRVEARDILRKLQRHRHLGPDIKRGLANSGWTELLVDA